MIELTIWHVMIWIYAVPFIYHASKQCSSSNDADALGNRIFCGVGVMMVAVVLARSVNWQAAMVVMVVYFITMAVLMIKFRS